MGPESMVSSCAGYNADEFLTQDAMPNIVFNLRAKISVIERLLWVSAGLMAEMQVSNPF